MHTKFILMFLLFALLPFAWPITAPASPAQITIVPGSAARGAALFQEKGCLRCHTFEGMTQGQNPIDLTAALWNHSPEMWRAQTARNVRPLLDSAEMADLFSYFFSLAYFTASGNPFKGEQVFEQKTCSRCHDAGGAAGEGQLGKRTASRREAQARQRAASRDVGHQGPPVSTWNEVGDPLAWAERMWDHSKTVSTEISANGLAWPQFSTEEMIDLLAYLRGVPSSTSRSAVFQPGDAEKGRIVFENSCESCHSFGGRTADPKIDLLKKPAPDRLTGYVVAMWNHAPLMQDRAGANFPILGPGDMSNLVAYLFAQRYFYGEGDANKGAKVFEEKKCLSCHEDRRRQTGAPDLKAATERYSPITVASALFRHGPAMLATMSKQEIVWPRFTGREMADLIAFLNNRLVRRVANHEN